jgi:hypothetical protein
MGRKKRIIKDNSPTSNDRKERADSVFSVYFDKVGRVDDTPVFL